jgi:hypothetical protein
MQNYVVFAQHYTEHYEISLILYADKIIIKSKPHTNKSLEEVDTVYTNIYQAFSVYNGSVWFNPAIVLKVEHAALIMRKLKQGECCSDKVYKVRRKTDGLFLKSTIGSVYFTKTGKIFRKLRDIKLAVKNYIGDREVLNDLEVVEFELVEKESKGLITVGE